MTRFQDWELWECLSWFILIFFMAGSNISVSMAMGNGLGFLTQATCKSNSNIVQFNVKTLYWITISFRVKIREDVYLINPSEKLVNYGSQNILVHYKHLFYIEKKRDCQEITKRIKTTLIYYILIRYT